MLSCQISSVAQSSLKWVSPIISNYDMKGREKCSVHNWRPRTPFYLCQCHHPRLSHCFARSLLSLEVRDHWLGDHFSKSAKILALTGDYAKRRVEKLRLLPSTEQGKRTESMYRCSRLHTSTRKPFLYYLSVSQIGRPDGNLLSAGKGLISGRRKASKNKERYYSNNANKW